MTRPQFIAGVNRVTAYQFLDDLRDSGLINMHLAGPSLQKQFGCSKSSARYILRAWMNDRRREGLSDEQSQDR